MFQISQKQKHNIILFMGKRRRFDGDQATSELSLHDTIFQSILKTPAFDKTMAI